MKVRSGFVSNSSSSSFIVSFLNVPEYRKELQGMLFGEDEIFLHPYDGEAYSCGVIAERVWADLRKASPMNSKDILDEIKSGSFEGVPEYPLRFWRQEGDIEASMKAYQARVGAAAKEVHDRFMALVKDFAATYLFEYKDHSGLGSLMEHGGIFDEAQRRGYLRYLRISNH